MNSQAQLSSVQQSVRKAIDDPVVGLKYLCIAAVAYIVLCNLPYGSTIMYPFTIFGTFYHEMGHGVSAAIMGFNFMKLTIRSDGSGFATYGYTSAMSTPVKHFLVSFSGPMTPSYVGSLLLLLSVTTYRVSRATLFTFGLTLVVVAAFLVRGTWFGMFFIPTAGLIIILIAYKASNHVVAFVIQFLGIQACSTAYRDFGYFFTYDISTDPNKVVLSDTGSMQAQLKLPYYVWAVIILGLSLTLFLFSLYIVLWRSWTRKAEEAPAYAVVHNPNDEVIDLGPDLQLEDFDAKEGEKL